MGCRPVPEVCCSRSGTGYLVVLISSDGSANGGLGLCQGGLVEVRNVVTNTETPIASELILHIAKPALDCLGLDHLSHVIIVTDAIMLALGSTMAGLALNRVKCQYQRSNGGDDLTIFVVYESVVPFSRMYLG